LPQENILVAEDVLKLADFGSCRGIYSKQPYTEYISTRWYRAPECLLTDGYYNYKMDIWGVGCVFFEIVSLFPLFPGTNELDQINKIHNILGTPTQDLREKFKRHSAHMDFNFPKTVCARFLCRYVLYLQLASHGCCDIQEGSGIAKLIPQAPPEAVSRFLHPTSSA
jgi:renal tumor antigen